MPTYLVTYHGGGAPPPTPEGQQQAMAAFGQWLASVGNAIVDPGAPLAASKSVSSSGSGDGPTSGPIAGYTLLRAADLDAAVQLVTNHPFVARGGTLQVSEAVDLGASGAS
jgi:hypothetical protein